MGTIVTGKWAVLPSSLPTLWAALGVDAGRRSCPCCATTGAACTYALGMCQDFESPFKFLPRRPGEVVRRTSEIGRKSVCHAPLSTGYPRAGAGLDFEAAGATLAAPKKGPAPAIHEPAGSHQA